VSDGVKSYTIDLHSTEAGSGMVEDKSAIVGVTLRLREDLRRSLEEAAKAKRISLNQEIIDRLEYVRDRQSLLAEVLRLTFGDRLAGLLLAIGLAMRGVVHTYTNPHSSTPQTKEINAIKELLGPVAERLTAPEVQHTVAALFATLSPVIETGNMRVNLDTKTVEVNGQRVHLTSREYQMLELLSLRKGTTLTKEMFVNHLYGGMDEPELKIIDVFMSKLRKKLQAATGGQHDYIETVSGRGYVLRDPKTKNVAA
jgi:DNA-binding winged helix-turn-helix (wHTH) protein